MERPTQTATASRRGIAAAFFLPVVLLLPFVNRAYNIDEPMFIWVAQQIVHAPLDFFGGFVERSGWLEPMYHYNQNPPGFSYYLAIFGVIGGWSEPVLRVGSLIAAGACSVGTYLLATRLCTRPFFAAALTVVTPGFLVSAATVMTDVGMTACYVWAVYEWLRWIDTKKRRDLAVAVALIAIGALLKYYAITLVPLLTAYTLSKKQRPGEWTLALVLPVAVLAAFFFLSWRFYGVNLLQVAAEVAQDPSVRAGNSAVFRELVTLVFVGGCFAPMALYAFKLFLALPLVGWAAAVIAATALSIDGFSVLQLLLGTTDRYGVPMLVQLGLMLAAGGVLAAFPIRDVWKNRDAEGMLLALWIFGAMFFTLLVNHLINARTLLPLAPAMAIVVSRGLPAGVGRTTQFTPVALGAALSLWVAWGDYAVAEGGRHAAREATTRAAEEKVALYYAGLWGFQYYLTRAGAKAFSVEGAGYGGEHKIKMRHGDFLVISSDSREKWRKAPERFEAIAFYSVANHARVATYHPADQAGFYSHLSGILPYKFGLTSQEEYGLYRWMGPSYAPSGKAP